MDIYKLKFTMLQQAILRFLCLNSGKVFTGRQLAKKLHVSPTAIAKALPLLKTENFVVAEKDEDSGRLSISLNENNPEIEYYKKAEDLKVIYESGIVGFLRDKFPNKAIVFLRSSPFVEICIIGAKAAKLKVEKFSKASGKKVNITFTESFGKSDKMLKRDILNGVVLSGEIKK